MSPLIGRYKYLNMMPVGSKRSTGVWSVRNNRSGDELGQVAWATAWRQYVFCVTQPSTYSASCLHDIEDFIETAERRRKAKP